MIIYSPLDSEALTSLVRSRPRHCFLMTQLGGEIHEDIKKIRKTVARLCQEVNYDVIDARSQVTGGDFLLKIWKLIASTPFSVAVAHEQTPVSTQLNIYYELGVAQALGKETLLVKSPAAEVPSDLVRTEYVVFDNDFDTRFRKYLSSLQVQADHYELLADILERNPVLALDYLKRAFLITGDNRLRESARALIGNEGLDARAKNSVERLAAAF